MLLFESPYRQMFVLVAVCLVLSLLMYLGYWARPGRHGWRRIEPSPMHWTGVVLGGALVLVFLYVRLFVGSARADAEEQMTILTGLIVAFTIGVAICVWSVVSIRRLALEWRGNWLAYSDRDGERIARSLDELTGIRRSPLGWLMLSFADGGIIKLDESARGSHEFLDSVAESRPDLLVPAD